MDKIRPSIININKSKSSKRTRLNQTRKISNSTTNPKKTTSKILDAIVKMEHSDQSHKLRKIYIYETLMGVLGENIASTPEFKDLYNKLDQTLSHDPHAQGLLESIISSQINHESNL